MSVLPAHKRASGLWRETRSKKGSRFVYIGDPEAALDERVFTSGAMELRRRGRKPGGVRGRALRDLEAAKARRDLARARALRDRRALSDLVLSPFGEGWEIGSGRDVHDAILAVEVGHAKGPDEDRIKAWIFKRATDLDVPELVPASWKGTWRPVKP